VGQQHHLNEKFAICMNLAIFSVKEKFILMHVISELVLCQKDVYGVLSERSLSGIKMQ